MLFLVVGTQAVRADNLASPTPNSDDQSESKKIHGSDASSTLIIHKPATDPAWGKVIQYQQETSASTHETLHKFLFQDSKGIIRTAIYHESSSENGYWEVWVWDLP